MFTSGSNRFLALATALVLGGVFSSTPVHAELTNCERVVVTGNPAYPPLTWAPEDGDVALTGVTIEMLSNALQGSGVEVELLDLGSRAKALEAVEAGQVDIMAGLFLSRELLSSLDFVYPPVVDVPSVFFVRRGAAFPYTGWQDFAVLDGAEARKVDPALGPLSTALGILGMPGLTAYLGLIDVGKPEPGDTVVVSAASGAVGAVVGQVAKIAGCRAVGLAGSARKIAYLTDELGFDAAINYKTEEIGPALDDACPDGINVYFENVGGVVAEAVYPRLAGRARVVVCGGVSQYNLKSSQTTVSNLQNILFTEAQVGGFNIFSYEARYEDGRKRLARWLAEGRLKYKEDVVEGLENAPAAFLRFFEGETFGKLLVKVAE